jgi:chemosensory pili system protein ChpA (sensor histidine kinase/response regulator)
MSDRRSYVALDWVNAQIAETLQQAIEALEGFIANPEDITKLRFGLTYIHQVSGSLVMVEIHAAARLSREMEGLINKVLSHERGILAQTDAARLIIKGIADLSAYINKVGKTHEENPKELLGLMNEIRDAAHQEKLSEADVFNPDIAVALHVEKQEPVIAIEEFNELIRKLRQSYQKGLIGIVRDKDLDSNYELVSKVCASLYKTSSNTASEPLWKIAAAIAEQLSFAGGQADMETKRALKLIDSQIKHLEDAGRNALLESPDATVLKTLLYRIATVEVVTEAVLELKAIYELDKALAQSETSLSTESQAVQNTVHAILAAMRADLTEITSLDIEKMHQAVSRLQNTCRIFGLGDVQANLQDIEQQLNSVIDESGDIAAQAETVAEQVQMVESYLASVESRQAGIAFESVSDKYQQFIADRRRGLEQIKEQVAEYVAGKCDAALIQELPDLLDEQIELLAISPLKRLGVILVAAQDYVRQYLLGSDNAPAKTALEALADAISSVDYYLERLNADSVENLEVIIRVAEESAAKLALAYDASDAIGVEVLETAANEDVYDDYSEVPQASASEEVEEPEEDIPVLQVESESVVEEVPAAEEFVTFVPGEDADEEILEIFIEEAREVIEHIREYLPALEADYNNIEALLEIRRSFHTLKGSGRMVGALHVGDFAWSVERMLNSVRDGIAKVTPNCIDILHKAVDAAPVLIDGMESLQPVSKSLIQNVIERADAEWEGKPKLAMAEPEVIEAAEATELEEISLEGDDNEALPVMEVEEFFDAGIEEIPEEPIDAELLEIFLAEAESHIAVLTDYLDSIDPGYEEVHVSAELQRAMHTLKGSSHMAQVGCIAILATPLESFVKDLNNFQTPVDSEILVMLVRAGELLQGQLARLHQGDMHLIEGAESFVKELKLIHSSRIEKHETEAVEEEGFADKYTALLSEALDCMEHSSDLIQAWQAEGIERSQQEELVQFLNRLSKTAGEAKYREIENLSAALAGYYSQAIDTFTHFDQDFFALANKAHDELDDMMNIIAAHQVVEPALDLIEELKRGSRFVSAEMPVETQKHVNKAVVDSSVVLPIAELREQVLAADPDTLEIFTEEAGELLDVLDALMQDWFDNHQDQSGLGEIKRIIHTLKGGARLTELKALGDLTHAYEGFIESAESEAGFNDAFFAKMETYQNQVAYLIEYIISGAYKQPLPSILEESLPDVELSEETAELPVAMAEFDEDEAEENIAALFDENVDEIAHEIVDEVVEEIAISEESDEYPALQETVVASIADDFDDFSDISVTPYEVDDFSDVIPATPEESTFVYEPESVSTETLEPEMLAAEPEVIEVAANAAVDNSYLLLCEQYSKADPDTLEIFLEEALELDTEIDEIVNQWMNAPEETKHADGMKRILHTLKGGARLAELSVLGDLTHHYESMIEAAEARKAFDEGFFAHMQSYQDQLHQMIEFIANGARLDQIPASAVTAASVAIAAQPEITPVDQTETYAEIEFASIAEEMSEVAQISPAPQTVQVSPSGSTLDSSFIALAEQYRKADQDTLEIFLEEALELDTEIDEIVNQWMNAHEEIKHADGMKRVLHTLKGGARLAELSVLGDLTHHYESMIEAAEVKKAFNEEFFGNIQSYQDQLHRMIDFIANGAKVEDIASMPSMEAAPLVSAVSEIMTPAQSVTEEEMPLAASGVEEIDQELLALFAEEAKEQNEGIEECIANFLKDPADAAPLEELKRLLHTLKGGARITGIRAIGDLSHDFETFIINSERDHKVNAGAFVDEMQVYHDKITKQIESIHTAAGPAVEQLKKPEAKPESNVVPIRPDLTVAANANAMLVSQASIDATRAFIDNFNKDQQRSNREPVKITPDLLEDLINLAGEGSIGRSRIEEQMNEIIISQQEMDTTVDRLHGQLRRLEIETEAQIVFRQEQVVSEGQENFDPLEMDRYTHMQQLSKSLIESASDLDDISVTFTNKMRDMETLLLQQARINTELQEGLMRCQMVPFSRMVPRLRRIVRQVAQELGKKVEFDVENAEGELDRTILERMVAPLEHMLRNAVDHGIEMPDVRKAKGKPQQGTIILALSREGGEIVLKLRDDGAGVNIEAVRNKAIERGLMTPDAQLTDHELSQFILHAGFSTAQKVTQISGRGVGMDVVHSEIKQMGGSLEISSQQNQGSIFTIRLPFTVSVNRALMVVMGTDTYAIPLNTIEGIVRVSPYELEAYYQPDAPMFEYAGQSYNLRYLGGLLHNGHRAKLEGLTTPLPVVLIRSSDYTVAVQVDKLLGSREVVVKSLGPQFGMVGGLSGATVLGNGNVVIILDMLSLIRTDFALGLSQAAAGRAEEYVPEVVRKITTVMVVDDSVTVRKVTSRLLERSGMKVILAKDGLDALTQLQEMDELPDVMLLDIEMPRMDGFEVVSRVRHDTRLQHIPITMITSRTGDKHRERAIALGANRYLGKPFQERELLQTISELTGAEIQQA